MYVKYIYVHYKGKGQISVRMMKIKKFSSGPTEPIQQHKLKITSSWVQREKLIYTL